MSSSIPSSRNKSTNAVRIAVYLSRALVVADCLSTKGNKLDSIMKRQ